MKKKLFGSFIGAIIVFGWQAISHMAMHHHDASLRQIPAQEEVIKILATYFKEEGQYIVPRSDLNYSQQEKKIYDVAMQGKPWALITYHPVYRNNMGLAIARSFVIAFISVWLLLFIMGKTPGEFPKVFLKCLGWGFFAFLFVWYNNSIWLHTPWSVLKGELIDIIIAWSLCGLWLGYWLNNEKPKRATYGKGFGV